MRWNNCIGSNITSFCPVNWTN